MTPRTAQRYIRMAREWGARAAKLIATRSVVTGEWVRLKCQFGCDGYGECLTCPPHAPTPDRTARLLKEYRSALLLHDVRLNGTTAIASQLERRLFLDGYYKALGLGSGPCRLCATCVPPAQTCRHAEEARPSMEACGIDVYRTARNNGFPIRVVTDHSAPQNYYGLVLVE